MQALYFPIYTGYTPFPNNLRDVKTLMCKEQMKLLCKIQQMQFVAIELQLFLDTHPCDKEALYDYNCAIEELNNFMALYEKQYGSLLALGHHGDETWNWINSPWPWQM